MKIMLLFAHTGDTYTYVCATVIPY